MVEEEEEEKAKGIPLLEGADKGWEPLRVGIKRKAGFKRSNQKYLFASDRNSLPSDLRVSRESEGGRALRPRRERGEARPLLPFARGRWLSLPFTGRLLKRLKVWGFCL